MLEALPFTGVITVGEAITGFSNANIVLIAMAVSMALPAPTAAVAADPLGART